MKVLQNTKTKIKKSGDDLLEYEDLIRSCLNDVPTNPATGMPTGYTRQDMKNRDRIEKVIDAAENGEFHFEDADAENLTRLVTGMRWMLRHEDVLQFVDDVEKMETVEPEKKDETSPEAETPPKADA